VVAETGLFLAQRLVVWRSLLAKGIGLMGRRQMVGDGVWMENCRSIHTCFLRFSIDVIFIARDLRLLRIVAELPPWRLVWAPKGTVHVVELPAGSIRRAKLTLDSEIKIIS